MMGRPCDKFLRLPTAFSTDEEIKTLKLKCDSYERTILQAGDQLKSGLI